MTDDEMLAAVTTARSIAGPIGPLHAYWDVIFDAEAILAGRPSILSRSEVEAELLKITAGNPI